ncbi:site-specific integrase [Nesterenkonia muleiensis]|uniref:site-specific integrase n=1 Tax=Nesterenkonia muleiensis TaxID=2282648 RepID=UPI000E72905F|nr:site-specific integrase [Nesterenkonia muleiensis]
MNEQARYPEQDMDFAPEMPQEWALFADLREEVLLDYEDNTARAYWADLQDVFVWAVERDKDILQLTEKELRQYMGLLRRRKYSESTIRRRITVLRLLYDVAIREAVRTDNPAKRIKVRKPS